jgi:hypothetical protein
VSTAETGSRGRRPGELHRRRVVLVSGSEGLAAMLEHLLGTGAALFRFASLREAVERDRLAHADTVVLDLAHDDAGTLGELRRRYGGELIVLAERGHRSLGVPEEPAWTLVERPFSAMTLAAALGLDGPDPSAAPAPKADRYPPVAGLRDAHWRPPFPPTPAPDPAPAPADEIAAAVKAAARRAPSWPVPVPGLASLVERASGLLAALTHGWRVRRRLRVAGFSAFALVAFTVAFVVASQSRCGPGCGAFGTGFSPVPTIASRDGVVVPSTTGPKRATTSTVIRVGGSPGTGAFEGTLGQRSTATAADRRATVTTRDSSPGDGPRPTTPTTRPSTTTPTTTPTTAPTTTTIALPTTTTVVP